METTGIIDKIIELSNVQRREAQKNDNYYYFTADFTWFESEDERINREYKEGKITQEDAFLELL